MEERPSNRREMLAEARDTSGAMVDRADASRFFADETGETRLRLLERT